MKRKGFKWLGGIAASLLVFSLAISICSAQDKPLQIILTSGSVRPSPGVTLGDSFKEVIEMSAGKPVEVKHFPASQMGTVLEQLDGVLAGSIQIMHDDLGMFENILPKLKVFSMPYLIKNQEHLVRVFKSDIGKEFSDEMVRRKGLRILGVVPKAFRHLTSNKPIRTPADLKGFKMRVPNYPAFLEIWRAFGASPTPIPWAEVYQALATGTVDGEENPAATFYAAKLYEVQKYCTLTRHVPGSILLVANNKWFLSLDKEMQETVQRSADLACEYTMKLDKLMDAGRIKMAESKGMTFIKPDLKVWEAPVKDLYKKFSSDFSYDLYVKVKKLGEGL
jgi:tripartite ATP-independent transporter DctP family solute receptor